MKRLFLSVTALGSLFLLSESMTIIPSCTEPQSSVCVSVECRAISIVQCVKFTEEGTRTIKGTFNSDTMILSIIGRNPRSVSKNPRYGDGTKYGDYYYVATGGYYFNL